MSQPNVLVLDSAVVPDSKECEIEATVLNGAAAVSLLHVSSERELLPSLPSADAVILWHHASLTELSIRKLERARVIVRNGVGVDNIDLAAAHRQGIPVCNVPDYGVDEVSDHAMAMALSLWRRLGPSSEDVRRGNWDWRIAEGVRRSKGKIFGIVGCGRIGTACARRAAVFGFDVVFYDPYVAAGYEKALGIRRVATLPELLEMADILSLHLPLSDETYHLIGEDQLARMKPQSYLVNTARGPVVDERALLRALQEGKLAGAAVDVVETEPFPEPGLLSLPNCIVTPHSAFYSVESLKEMREKSATIVLNALLGRELSNVVS
ncbi:MAG: C-terminal binding protein [Acidobacteriota bacterium]